MTRALTSGVLAIALLACAGAAPACPFGETAATDQTTTTTSQLPPPATDGTAPNTTGDESKTGG